MTNTQTTFARVITEAIFETSRLSDCNTVETAEALLAVLRGNRLLRGAR
jgi:hypothetical protein